MPIVYLLTSEQSTEIQTGVEAVQGNGRASLGVEGLSEFAHTEGYIILKLTPNLA